MRRLLCWHKRTHFAGFKGEVYIVGWRCSKCGMVKNSPKHWQKD